jgi:hypothetical protein
MQHAQLAAPLNGTRAIDVDFAEETLDHHIRHNRRRDPKLLANRAVNLPHSMQHATRTTIQWSWITQLHLPPH